ncbi:MAG: hypothetical protein RRB22_02625 [Gammaproteobacteria bacterium]|nr:hypothetical protein [Gammaproteobacteria bacterium]
MSMLSAGNTGAATWDFGYDVALTANFNDNQRLTPESQESIFGHYLDVEAQVVRAAPKSDLTLHPRYRLSRYSKDTGLDNDVVQMDVSTRLLGEKSVSSVTLDWLRDTTLTSELEDTGLIEAEKYRTVRGVHPSYQYQYSERLKSDFLWHYTDVAYQDASLTGLTNYRYQSYSGSLVYAMSSLNSIQADLYGSQLDAPDIGNQVVDTGVRVSISHAFHKQANATFTIGAHQLETTTELPGPDFASTRHGFLGDVAYSQEQLRTSWKLKVQRSIEPSGYGQLVQSDRIDINASERLSPYWTLKIAGLYLQNYALESTQSFDSRQYARLTTSAAWRLSREWQITMRYARQWQKYESASRDADSNEIAVGIAYRLDNQTLHP